MSVSISIYEILNYKIDKIIYKEKAMAIRNVPLNELPPFGRRLMELAIEKECDTPILLAHALYKSCKDLVEPATRRNKKGQIVKDEQHDIDAIRRMVQRHFNAEKAAEVQSNYLLAYSRLFDCSLDYLYGVSKVKSIDLSVQDICEKLHVDEKMVLSLMEEFDPDPEVFSPTTWWSDMLSSDLFSVIPRAWQFYCMEELTSRDLEKKIEAIKKAEESASDSVYRTMMEVRRISLEKMQSGRYSDCAGAYGRLTSIISKYLSSTASRWVDLQHPDLSDNYYDNEMKKIEILEAALREGSEPVKK